MIKNRYIFSPQAAPITGGLLKLSLLLFFVLPSCSIFRAESSVSLPLPGNLIESSRSWSQVHDSDENLYTYRTNTQQVFATSIKDCNKTERIFDKEQERLVPSLSRELFVGLQNTRITGQEIFTVKGSNIYHFQAEALFEQTPLVFSHYMTAADNCLLDIITWKKQDAEQKTTAALPDEEVALLFQSVFQ